MANTTCPRVASGAHWHSQELEEEELSRRRDAHPFASLEEGPRDPSELCAGKTDDSAAEEDGSEGILQPELPPIPEVGRAPGALVTGRWLLNINTCHLHYTQLSPVIIYFVLFLYLNFVCLQLHLQLLLYIGGGASRQVFTIEFDEAHPAFGD